MGERQHRAAPLIRALEPEDAAELASLQAMPGYRAGTLRPPFPTASAARTFLERGGPDDLLLGAFLDGCSCPPLLVDLATSARAAP
jgi:hypothetical protein